jgi:predicted nucleic acid-binding protein
VILLDANVISELMRQTTSPSVLNWVDALDPQTVAITAMNDAENLHGLSRLHDGGRKQGLRSCWEELLAVFFTVRVLQFSIETAHWYVELLAHRERLGRTMHCADAVIAAIALAHGPALATLDVSVFTGIGLVLINPWCLS